MELDAVTKAFVAGQNTHFREMVKGWALDEDISNEEFSRLVTDLDWAQACDRMEWQGKMAFKNRVDGNLRSPEEILADGEIFRG